MAFVTHECYVHLISSTLLVEQERNQLTKPYLSNHITSELTILLEAKTEVQVRWYVIFGHIFGHTVMEGGMLYLITYENAFLSSAWLNPIQISWPQLIAYVHS